MRVRGLQQASPLCFRGGQGTVLRYSQGAGHGGREAQAVSYERVPGKPGKGGLKGGVGRECSFDGASRTAYSIVVCCVVLCCVVLCCVVLCCVVLCCVVLCCVVLCCVVLCCVVLCCVVLCCVVLCCVVLCCVALCVLIFCSSCYRASRNAFCFYLFLVVIRLSSGSFFRLLFMYILFFFFCFAGCDILTVFVDTKPYARKKMQIHLQYVARHRFPDTNNFIAIQSVRKT